eukprot:jgi/Hompol1/964/HPOL_005472-RA
MVACQATCRWSDQPDAAENFEKHFNRAVLQVMIVELKLLPNIENTTDIIVGRLGRKAVGHGFIVYAKLALKRLGIEFPTATLTEDVLESYAKRFEHRKKEIAVVWTLRSMMAEALESLLVLDRFLYLVEADRNMYVRVIPIFEHKDSPRNMAIIAVKKSHDTKAIENDVDDDA